MNHSSPTGNGLIQKENRSETICGIAKHSQTVLSKFYYKKRTKIKLRSRCIFVYTAVKMVLGGGFKYIQYIQTFLLYSTNYVHIKYHACICTLQCSTWEILWGTTMRWRAEDKKGRKSRKALDLPHQRHPSLNLDWSVDSVLGSHFHCCVILVMVALEGVCVNISACTDLFASATAERYAFWSGLTLTWSWGCKWKAFFEIVQSF